MASLAAAFSRYGVIETRHEMASRLSIDRFYLRLPKQNKDNGSAGASPSENWEYSGISGSHAGRSGIHVLGEA